jgi:glycosyltransferase involved in cell wall biosynthesis
VHCVRAFIDFILLNGDLKMAEIIFFLALLLVAYTYFGYPIILWVFAIFINRDVRRGEIYPAVSIIIPVHNEALHLGIKLSNCAQFNYPKDKLTIIVVSDNSDDNTAQIVSSFPLDNIRYLDLPFRGGKVGAQNHALQECNSEIIIFTDVAILTDPDCVKLIVQNFHDPDVGVVSCRDAVVVGKTRGGGEKEYIQYDMLVRRYTSQMGSLIGVTGGFYAVRAAVAKGGWNPAFPPDFYVALRSLKRRLRVVEDPRVKAYYKTASAEWDELPRKVRTINRGINALFSVSNRQLLNPFRFGIVSLQLISHKILRWMTPFFLIALFLCNMLQVCQSPMWTGLFISQCVFYLSGMMAYWYFSRFKTIMLFRLIHYFNIANLAILKAWYDFFSGKKYISWQPTKR